MTVVVVTGASSGVGRATARAFAAAGADVGLLARGEDGLEGARRDVEALGRRALAVPTDVALPDDVEAAAEAVEAELGPIDVWVNCAMLSVFAPVKELEHAEARRVTEVTYLGYVHGSLAALRRMLPRGRGTIVQVGSALAYRSIPLQALYCGAKSAVRAFTESLRTELLHDGSGVRVTQVHLPAHDTPQFQTVRTRLPRHPRPIAPVYDPEVAARAIVRAARDAPRESWVGFSTTGAIVGNRVAPGLLDRYMARTGYDAQQTDEPVAPGRPDNLWAALPGDRGARGRFGDEARDRSVQQWLVEHRAGVVAALVAGLAAAVLARSAD